MPTVYRRDHISRMDESDIGARIIQAYEGAGMNRNQFAQAIKTTYANVMRWEKGETEPKAPYLRKISEVCGVSLAWLITGEGSERESRVVPIEEGNRADASLVDEVAEELGLEAHLVERLRQMNWTGGVAPSKSTLLQHALDMRREARRLPSEPEPKKPSKLARREPRRGGGRR